MRLSNLKKTKIVEIVIKFKAFNKNFMIILYKINK